MKSRIILASLALAMATTGCGNTPVEGAGADSYSVQPNRVDSAQLQTLVDNEEVRRFYEARGWEAAWTAANARDLLDALRDSERHGMNAEQFLREADAAATPTDREAALSLAAIAYGGALARGYANPESLAEIYELDRPQVDVAAGLSQAVEAGGVRAWLDGLAPQDAEYRALSEAYLQYRRQAAELAQADSAGGVAEGDALEAGDSDPRVPQIVEALRANGYLASDFAAGDDPNLFSPAVAEGVAAMQRDYGIEVDGVVGPDTLAALNTGPADRARILALNLERRRWLAREVSPDRIDVNIPAAFMDYYRDGRLAHQARVIVGTSETDTPPIASPIFRLVANPSWTVPQSIAERDILPRGAAYMRSRNMTMRDGWIVQPPGPRNALGQVKFDMKNDHAIFLHDTPDKDLFGRQQRQLSNGCVRVEDALGFADRLAADHGDRAAFQRALQSGEETFVDLNREIAVRMLYHTAYVDGSGNVVFRTDPYGWDEDLAQALGMEARTRRQIQAPTGIAIGP